MSLKDDLDMMRRHKSNGTLKEWLEGTAPQLPSEPWPNDPSSGFTGSTHKLVCLRGD
tara:strand:+ start:2171 stop:2341 length:171 start_codon:yes stop_codon:yes gene_type:complete